MNKAITIESLGELEVISTPVLYSQDPTSLFYTLCHEKTDSLLLESAEVDSKEDLQSLLLVDSAVRIVCHGEEVTFSALSDNGQKLIEHLAGNVSDSITSNLNANQLVLKFEKPNVRLDEDSRLRQASSFDALRLVQHSFDLTDKDKHAIFLGGLFAYDLVANFEAIGNVESNSKCPDYVFYVAETLLVIDHQTKTKSATSKPI